MTSTIGKLGPRQFFEPGFEVTGYFYFGARICSTQHPPYDAHILQGLLTRRGSPAGNSPLVANSILLVTFDIRSKFMVASCNRFGTL